jgi:phosphate transport system permease protein
MSSKAQLVHLLPDERATKQIITKRLRVNRLGRMSFVFALLVGIIALVLLGYNIIRSTFTIVAIENTIDPSTLSDRPLDELNDSELLVILSEHSNPNRLRVFILDNVAGAPQSEWSILNQKPVDDILEEGQYPSALAGVLFSELQLEQTISILETALSQDALVRLVEQEVVEPRVVQVWGLDEALFQYDDIKREAATKYPDATLEFHSWINLDFLTNPMNSQPELAGLRTAILGSLWMMAITISFAFPVGVGAAIYLEEYAADNWLTRIIQINISNLAGVPSIIYGILGLAVFVRALEPLTSGQVFGAGSSLVTASGRTILSAGLTLALLILPIIIISAREAIRAVPHSLREAAYGLGATRWQVIRTVVLPQAMPSILTGTILAVSRAFGETAPLVVVGSITRITVDPEGPFSRFTAIPIQIYTWTAQPQDAFRSAAGAAIIILLMILLTFNSTAIILRNRLSKRY